MNTDKRTSSDLIYISFIILQGLIFGIGNPIVKFAYESISPIWCLAIRFVLAMLVFLIFFGKTTFREIQRVKIRVWLPTSLCMAGAYITCNVALNLTAATNVGFLMALAIVFTPFLSRLVLGRKIHKAFLPVPFVAVIGLYLISINGGSFHFGPGEFLSLACSFAMAGSLVWGEECLATLSPGTVSLTQTAVTAAASILCAVLLEPFPNLTTVEPVAWWIMIYLVLFCSCLCYILQNIALTHISAAVVSLTQCSEPLFTAICSFLILGERLSATGFLGAALLMICIVYGNYIESKTTPKELST